MPKLKADLFKVICDIADTPSSRITAKNLQELLGGAASKKLITDKVLIPAPHNQDIDAVVNDEERSYPVQNRNGGRAYFSPSSGWVKIKDNDLVVYQVDFSQLQRVMMDALGIPANIQSLMIVNDGAWFLGTAWLKKQRPLLFLPAELPAATFQRGFAITLKVIITAILRWY